jgi:hypothetical protein
MNCDIHLAGTLDSGEDFGTQISPIQYPYPAPGRSMRPQLASPIYANFIYRRAHLLATAPSETK